ncbi:hypothetical protein VTN96DRAFT_5350 [Rasamsonia emersonii]
MMEDIIRLKPALRMRRVCVRELWARSEPNIDTGLINQLTITTWKSIPEPLRVRLICTDDLAGSALE